ncbi:MAG: YajQ family cyclic di-GMP-binding protein [Acidobacteriia bacterium]|nr:YajQ family cyclic di-GMP-binding protein [Terriglobia bacterium]
MAAENSFDIVSRIDKQEVSNAIQQALKEIHQRFDFKGSKSSIELLEDKIVLVSDNDFKLKAVTDILEQKLVKRGVPLKGLAFGKVEPSAQGTVRQEVTLQQGISPDKAREIIKSIKETKLKVQSSINGDFVRVSGKDRDTLQNVIAHLRALDFGIHMQFVNYRSQ